METEFWVTMICTVTGVIVGGLLALVPVHLTNRFQEKNKRRSRVLKAASSFYANGVRALYELHYHSETSDPGTKNQIWEKFTNYDTQVMQERVFLIFLLAGHDDLADEVENLFQEYRSPKSGRNIEAFLEKAEMVYTKISKNLFKL